MLIAAILLLVAMGLGWLSVRLVRRLVPAVLPMPLELESAMRISVEPQNDEVDLATRIGGVISDGMDRVDAMRQFGADRFLTFMPMPDGTCWSLTVVRHPDETSAKASYSRRPEVTH